MAAPGYIRQTCQDLSCMTTSDGQCYHLVAMAPQPGTDAGDALLLLVMVVMLVLLLVLLLLVVVAVPEQHPDALHTAGQEPPLLAHGGHPAGARRAWAAAVTHQLQDAQLGGAGE
jgi:hypothetical protein